MSCNGLEQQHCQERGAEGNLRVDWVVYGGVNKWIKGKTMCECVCGCVYVCVCVF